MLGEKGAINGDHFCQGYVVVYPGDSVLEHEHITGHPERDRRDDGSRGDTAGRDREFYLYAIQPASQLEKYRKRGPAHDVRYVPKMIVDHWTQEPSGELKQERSFDKAFPKDEGTAARKAKQMGFRPKWPCDS